MMIALSSMTAVFQYFPPCALGVIVLSAVLPLLDFRIIPLLWRLSKFDLLTMAVAFLVTLLFGVQIGIVAAVGVSIFITLMMAARPHTARLGRLPGSVVYRSVATYTDAVTAPGVLVYRFDAQIFYGNAGYFRVSAIRLVNEVLSGPLSEGGIRALVLDCASVTMIDATGVQALRDVAVYAAKRNIGTCLFGFWVLG